MKNYLKKNNITGIISLLFILVLNLSNAQNMEICYKVDFQPQRENETKRVEYRAVFINDGDVFSVPHKKLNDSLGIDETFLDFSIHLKNSTLEYYGFFNDLNFYYEEDIPKKWDIIPNSFSTYKNYPCQKAKIVIDNRTWIATFTSEIPLFVGPYKFQGLPGLILEIHSQDGAYIFEMITLKKTTKKAFTFVNYKKMKKNKLTKYISNFLKDPASKNIYLKNRFGDVFNYKYSGKKDKHYQSMNKYISEVHQKYNNPIDKTTYILVQ